MSVKLLTEQQLEFLSLKGGCTGWSESTSVKMPHCWKQCVTAQLYGFEDNIGPNERSQESLAYFMFVLMLYVPVNNFSVMSGQFPDFLG